MRIHVFEWAEDGLKGIRLGHPGEFAELDAREKKGREAQARDYLLHNGTATAGDVADAIGWARNHTSSMLNAANWAGKRRDGQRVLYFVKEETGVAA
jgi:hypothetical protein